MRDKFPPGIPAACIRYDFALVAEHMDAVARQGEDAAPGWPEIRARVERECRRLGVPGICKITPRRPDGFSLSLSSESDLVLLAALIEGGG